MKNIHFLKPVLLLLVSCACSDTKGNAVFLKDNNLIIRSNNRTYAFAPKFTILYRVTDPKLRMRPAGIDNVAYNVATWLVEDGKQADLRTIKRNDSQTGDGFDDSILSGETEPRTLNYYNSGQVIEIEGDSPEERNDTIFWKFKPHKHFELTAFVVETDSAPKLHFTIMPRSKGYFSIGYTGAPAIEPDSATEIWQPFIWQEKRFPKNSYLTLAYRTPLPTTFFNDGNNTLGLLAAPEEFPFNPLPTLNNSRFGVILRNQDGLAQPQLFAPVLGGMDSKMDNGKTFDFSSYLIVDEQPLTYTYEKLARDFFGFKDYRKNTISSLNDTFDNIVDYGNSSYGRYVDSLKGYEYSTDVPGAVKNVSSLHPLELALVTDNPKIFKQKAYPMMEYMLSREKFLFSLNPEQKIQYPSRKLNGPTAPISELTSLYNITNKANPFLLEMAEKEYRTEKIRNLDVVEKGETWINAMFLFKASGDTTYLNAAKQGADQYLKNRVEQKQTDFKDPFGRGFFFWVAFTNRWIELLELYELTSEQKYLDAAHEGARHYTLFTWMAPKIPDDHILVNKDDKAPMYWYLKSKGHTQMFYPEEKVPAWRLSEVGLTPESSGTSTGHRGIFMANYAPWMLRIGEYTNDDFLKEVAKASIIGRYRNFPGYHINTERTTAYEKLDFPLHEHKELSVNSFHYNHILPMASMLLDYLVTDVWTKSDRQIHFPSEYIEGYAYLINKFYGNRKGRFYDIEKVQLWMPKNLLTIENTELNYITAKTENQLLIALSNQSDKKQKTKVTINNNMVELNKSAFNARVWKNNTEIDKPLAVQESFEIEVPPSGITAMAINYESAVSNFQTDFLTPTIPVSENYQEFDFGNGRAMTLSFGKYTKNVFLYLQDDDSVYRTVTLRYSDKEGNKKVIEDTEYPYEFTIPVDSQQHTLEFELSGINIKGKIEKSKKIKLGV